MMRLAGITSVYALIAALLLVTPLSASQDPVPEVADVEQSQEAAPEPIEPVPTVPEAVPPEAPPAEATPPPEPVPVPAPPPEPAAPAVEAPEQPVQTKPEPKARRSGDAPRATAAADTGVTISDFQFAPSSVTVDAGDTVTWTNDGPTPHSATADDGSFDTGIFDAGQSRSHTFEQAGTFAYFCTPHPNMRGTINVRAASTGGGGGGTTGGESGATGGDSGATGGDSGAAGTGSGTSGDSSGSGLPATGLDTRGVALLGLLTLALGAFLRRRAGSAG